MIKTVFFLLIVAGLSGSISITATPDSSAILITTTNEKLQKAFEWAVEMALSHVQTGKTGVADKWERGAGTGTVAYIPSYWAGYNFRSAFYSRDVCHQVTGGHLLNLETENFTMLREFARTSTAGRKWYPLWALNFDGSPFRLDYRNNSDFVREVPAAFELVEKSYKMFQWTGDRRYIEDEVLWNFYSHIVNDFIELHDIRKPNGVAEGDGSGNIFRGTATYNEERDIPLIEAGDGIACQYRALEAYAMMAKARKNEKLYRKYSLKADELRKYFNTEWSVKQGARNIVRGYNSRGEALTNWGKENSWFMLMKGIVQPGERRENYLSFVDYSASSLNGRPANIEARSYLPETFFNNNRNELGWKWMLDMIESIEIKKPASETKGDGTYPEISFVLISNVIEGLMGLTPDAPGKSLFTISRLPEEIPELMAENIPVGNASFKLTHTGVTKSSLHFIKGDGRFSWEAGFYGSHPVIMVNGTPFKSSHKILNGSEISYVVIKLRPGESAEATVHKKELKVGGLESVLSPSPRFSWQIMSEKRNQIQSAYEIEIAYSKTELLKGENRAWRSGRIESDRSLLVENKGFKTEPGRSFHWRVKVWNTDGEESDWSEPASFTTGLFNDEEWSGAVWIGYKEMPTEKRMVPGVHGNGNNLGELCLERAVIPYFRKDFGVEREVSDATLFITGLGHYEATINGVKVGNGFLTPGWTNYDSTILYNTYDVTNMICNGQNAISVICGNGFYNINRERYRKLVIAWGNPKIKALLKIRFRDGSEQYIITDSGWRTAPSPITYTSIYGGEDYDSRLEQKGWDKPGFNDSDWENAKIVTPPGGILTAESDYPVEIMEKIQPVAVTLLNDGAYLYDFGQNASAIVELKVKGKRGQEIKLIPSELVYGDRQPNQNASGSPYYFTYILSGEGVETWRPRFSYYGFRYVKVEGAVPAGHVRDNDEAQIIGLGMLHNRNSTPARGSFSCSNDLFNRTFNLINWGIKSNLQSVVTDCPHREKLGWLEQTYLMGSSIHFNFDLYRLYSKLVNDMMEARLDNGLVPDIAPEYVVFQGGFRDSPEWGSASVILPWLIHKWYGDTEVMKKAWPMMTRYAGYLKSRSDNHILSHGLGDWFDYGPRQPGEAQLTPKSLTATAIYYYDVRLLADMASILGKDDEQRRFNSWALEIKSAFNRKFFNPGTGVISTGSQTAMAMPWCVGLVDEEYSAKVLQNLEDSIRANGKPLTAGDIGFRYLVEALTRGGKSQLLYEMNARDDVPGYGFQLRKGATALTESWPALENVSNNHLMLGHLMDWFYAGLGGIGQTRESTAYREIVINPEMIGDISWVKSSFNSPYGLIRSDWQKSENLISMHVEIPVNTTALIYVPYRQGAVIKLNGREPAETDGMEIRSSEEGRKVYRVGSGVYNFEILHQ